MSTDVARLMLLDSFDRFRDDLTSALTDLDEAALVWRPAPGANPMGWIAWHVLRVQDDHLADVGGVEQAWFANGWQQVFGLPYPPEAHGYGQSDDDVAAWRGAAPALIGYANNVNALTHRVLDRLTDYARIVDPRWDPPVTAAVRLVSVVDEVNQHLGQIAYLKGLYGRRG